MRAVLGFAVLLVTLIGVHISSALCPQDFAATVTSPLSQAAWQRTYFGIHVIYQNSSGGWTTLFDLNGDKFFTPASNNKLLTSAAFFTKLGSSWQWKTPVYNMSGNSICVSGRGDPSMTYETIYNFSASLSPFISGGTIHVNLDDTYILGEQFPVQWEWEDLSADYGAMPTAFSANENVVTVIVTPASAVGQAARVTFVSPSDKYAIPFVNIATTGPSSSSQNLTFDWQLGSLSVFLEGNIPLNSAAVTIDVAVPDPTGYWGSLLSYAIKQHYGAATVITRGPCDSTSVMFTEISSAPVSVTMNWTLQMSDNLYAESYSRTLGLLYAPGSEDATLDGIAAVEAQLASLGIDTTAVIQQDGSGVARSNLVTPAALTQVLVAMDAQPEAELYRSFLPLAGETGTLQTRFVGTPAQGIVQAKTGTLMSVSALSGYLIHPQFPKIIFSIIVNHSDQGTTARQNIIDSIVINLAQLVPCSSGVLEQNKITITH